MSDFNEEVFPYVFECSFCGEEQRVTWREAVDYAPEQRTPADATEKVLQTIHGWWQLPEGVTCPDCIEESSLDMVST